MSRSVTLCPPNRRTRHPRWGQRLLTTLREFAFLQLGMDDRGAYAYALEVMKCGLADLLFAAARRGEQLQLAPRRHACVYDEGP